MAEQVASDPMGAGWSPRPIAPERSALLGYLALPWRRFDIDTHLTPEQCTSALEAIVEPRKRMRLPWTRSARDFEGEVNGLEFSIQRIIRYSNSFLPVISGTILQGFGATRVRITMSPNRFVLAVWVFSMTAAATVGGFLLFHGTDRNQPPAAAFASAMLLFGYLVCVIPFAIEAQKARRILTQAFSGTLPPARS